MKAYKIPKRPVQLSIISDVHLGTFGCHAGELLQYLRSIRPKTLILNGDIIDIWQFRKSYFPENHMMVIRQIINMIANGTRVIYITGNHDELLRKFVKFRIGTFELVNKIILELDGQKAWIFHGDVFDVTMQYSKWLAKLGSSGYDLLILLNSFVNFFLVRFGRDKISFSKKIKNSVKSAVSFISKFEETAAGIAISKNYHYVVCGHIHQPEIKQVKNHEGEVIYLNSGDWVENLTALEYDNNAWSLYYYEKDDFVKAFNKAEEMIREMKNPETLDQLFRDLHLT